MYPKNKQIPEERLATLVSLTRCHMQAVCIFIYHFVKLMTPRSQI